MTEIRGDDARRGIVLMLLGFLCFTCIDVSAKWLVGAGLPARQVVFVRYVVHFLIVAPTLLVVAGGTAWRMRRPALTLTRGLCLMLSTACNFTALSYLPITLTTAVFFASPLLIGLLSVPLLGERVGGRRWAAILVGFSGVLIVTRPWSEAFHPAVFLSFGALTFASLYFILTRRLAGIEQTSTQQFYASLIAVVLLLPLAVGDWVWPQTWIDWIPFCLIGVFGWGGHQLAIVAHRFASASTLAPFVYVQIVFASIASWLIFATPPDAYVLAGAAVLTASGLYLWYHERK